MKIVEIFESIQGEAQGIGEPSVFVRLAKCNLACEWCDSKYALGEEYNELEVEKVFKQIKEYNNDNIVITGGEPLLQMGPLTYLVMLLCYEGLSVTIETNGTISPNKILLDKVSRWNVSPKFENLNYSVLKEFENTDNVIFKFVVQDENQIKKIQDVQEVVDIIDECIYLMPCARMREAYITEAPKVVEWCKKYGYNFSPREHIVIWDDKRGF